MLKIKDCRKFMKKCKSCGKLKLISDFVKDSNTKEGYRNQCKICKNSKEKLRYSLVCLECGKEFTSGSKKQKFCSKECTIKNQYNKEEVLCEHCRKPIKLKKSEIKSVTGNGVQKIKKVKIILFTREKSFCVIVVKNL